MPFVTGGGDGGALGAKRPHSTLFWKEGHHQSVWHEGWKLIRCGSPEKSWLFHTAIDPTEQTNLADRNPHKVKELQALLDSHNAQLPPPGWPSVLQFPQLIDRASIFPNLDIKTDDEYLYWPN